MIDYTKRAVRGSAIIFLGIIAAAFVSYLIRIVLARKLSVEEFGLFYAVFIFITFFGLFRDLGLNSAIVKYIPEFKIQKKPDQIKSSIIFVLIVQLISAIIFIIILFALSNFLAENYFKNPLAAPMLKVLSLIFVLFIFDDLLKKSFQGFQKMRYFSLIELGKNSTVLILILLFFHFTLGIFSPVIAYILVSPIIFFIFFPFFLKIFPFFKYKIMITKKLIKKLTFFGLPTVLTGIGEKVIGYVDVLLLTYFTTLTQVGIYNIVLPTTMLFLFFSRSICLVMFPMASELWIKKEYKKLSEGLRRLHKYAFVVIIPVVLALLAFSKLFIKIIFGEAYVAGALAMQIILIGVIFFTLAKINNSIITGIGKPKVVAKIILIAALVNFIVNLILIPRFGIIGAAIATALSYILALVLSNREISKLIKVKIPWPEIGKIFISGIIFVFMIYFLKKIIFLNIWLELITILIISGALYIFLVFLFKITSIKEIKGLLRSVI